MEIPTDVKEKILKLKNKLPEDKQDRFVSNMKGGFEKLTESNMTSSALIGAILGSVIDFIPGSGFVSDDWTEIGAAIGAFIGYRKD
ncbi:hypothetical protein, partial [Desulfobacter vibrioformis]|uniref:hypothetical protein n=1 Tax=Desulfobacter vibrioformis TaxID=34031 RepID=UPI000557AA3D